MKGLALTYTPRNRPTVEPKSSNSKARTLHQVEPHIKDHLSPGAWTRNYSSQLSKMRRQRPLHSPENGSRDDMKGEFEPPRAPPKNDGRPPLPRTPESDRPSRLTSRSRCGAWRAEK